MTSYFNEFYQETQQHSPPGRTLQYFCGRHPKSQAWGESGQLSLGTKFGDRSQLHLGTKSPSGQGEAAEEPIKERPSQRNWAVSIRL